MTEVVITVVVDTILVVEMTVVVVIIGGALLNELFVTLLVKVLEDVGLEEVLEVVLLDVVLI